MCGREAEMCGEDRSKDRDVIEAKTGVVVDCWLAESSVVAELRSKWRWWLGAEWWQVGVVERGRREVGAAKVEERRKLLVGRKVVAEV
ncbi:hypothetical protein AMTR_s00132p00017480 [Amborella trichopoda]|uniref:Uncharacterized protein n=1 Tax=Amborella trichopoda TaxID=13333 RepID=W1NDF8_AMBTC|nr:hypothetical protein AMTR_s00132p00017480 [Amborella trichopoda]